MNAAIDPETGRKLDDFMAKNNFNHSQAVRMLVAIGLRDLHEAPEGVAVMQAVEEAYIAALRAYHDALKDAAKGVHERFRTMR